MEPIRFARPLAVAALACVLAGAVWVTREEPVPPPATAEPDLFPFLKSGNAAFVRTLDDTSTIVNAAAERRASNGSDTNRHDARPEHVQQGRSALAQLAAVQQAAKDLRARGASDDEIYRMRAAALSTADASRLADMERAEAAWQQRVDSYLVEQEALRAANGNGSEVAQEQALQQLRDMRFSIEEQKRLAAYESPRLPRLTLPALEESAQ